MNLENSKLRRIILVEHEGLRMALRALEGVLERAARGDVAALKAAQGQLQALLEALSRHIEHEEALLRPVLMTIDAWGPARVQSMDEEHAAQRVVVANLAALDPIADPAAWVSAVRAFGADLLRDMADEEKTCLSPKVLRDDVITIDAEPE